MAIRKEENNLIAEASIYWDGGILGTGRTATRVRGARQILDDELAQFQGDGSQDVIQVMDEFANAGVESII